jgi:hypothetical protein
MPLTGQVYHVDTVPDPDGRYEFPADRFRIPVGSHRLTVVRFTSTPESLTKFVTVAPRVGAIVDFRLASTFIGSLRIITNSIVAYGDQSEHVTFEVINTGLDTIRLDSVMFFRSDTAYCETLKLRRIPKWDWQTVRRAGVNESVPMAFPAQPESIPGMTRIPVDLKRFMNQRVDPATPVNMHGRQLHLKFSDGSTVDITIP